MKSKYNIILFLSFVLLFLSAEASDRVLCITIGATKDKESFAVAEGSKKSLLYCNSIIAGINRIDGVELTHKEIVGDDYTYEKISNIFNGIPRDFYDSIFVYIVGHASRKSSDTSTLPRLYASNGGDFDSSHYYDLSEAYRKCDNSGADFVLFIADCCNKVQDRNFGTEARFNKKYMASLGVNGPENTKAFKKLFLETRGRVYGCTASVGQKSWLNNVDGSVYINAFKTVFRESISVSDNPSWKGIIAQSKSRTEMTSRKDYEFQSPNIVADVFEEQEQHLAINNNYHNNVPNGAINHNRIMPAGSIAVSYTHLTLPTTSRV